MKLTPEVEDVLRRSEITPTSVKLPPEQLERKLYEAVNKVLVMAGGKWNRKERAHLFQSDPRAKLGLVLETGEAVNEKKELQAFDTPREVCRIVIEEAHIEPGMHVLEPSAGLGMLALEARDAGGIVDCVEISGDRAAALTRLVGLNRIHCGDFLDVSPPLPSVAYDRVVMNPPFANNQDVRHVAHALKFVQPGGRLVAIMWPNLERRAMSDLLAGRIYSLRHVEEGAFKKSGTNVRTLIVTIDK